MPRRIQHAIRSTSRLVRTFDDMTHNPEEIDTLAKLMRLVVARDYPYHIDRSRASFSKALRDLETNYRKAIRSAHGYEDTKEVQRLAQQWPQDLMRLVGEWRGQ